MNGLHQNDHYYDSRSPRLPSHNTQTLHRQSSRHFDTLNSQQGQYDGINRGYDDRNYDRMTQPQNGYGDYGMTIPQAWNNSAYTHNNTLPPHASSARLKPVASRGRPPIPQGWMDQGLNNGFPNMGLPPSIAGPHRTDLTSLDPEEDLIPTAIVIKNIPFAVKKEQLMQVMTDMCLPLPYAFNYHFDNGIFRGLAFANFTTAEETAAVITAMNHLELHGRKLRVEYKKMLPQAERDRIEREKRERRGQLEEQHRPVPTSQLQTRPSISSMSPAIRPVSPSANVLRSTQSNMDMNDPTVLNYYSKLILFQSDPTQGDELPFPATLPPQHRKVIHELAHLLGLDHVSDGHDDQRYVRIYRFGKAPNGRNAPSFAHPLDVNRRGLYRSATTDFSDVRDLNNVFTVGSKASAGYLTYNEPHSGGLSAASNLRAAKSVADLRTNSPSPSHSTSAFPTSLAANIPRFTEYSQNSPGAAAGRSNMPPIGSVNGNGTDSMINGMNNMTLTSTYAATNRPGSPARLRNVISWDRENPGPIGGHRSFSANVDEQGRNRSQNGVVAGPSRQPRGPTLNNGGFSRGRQNGHHSGSSDELSQHLGVDTVLE